MLKMEIFRLGTTNGDKRLGMIIIFLNIYTWREKDGAMEITFEMNRDERF
jgi:hypothetical protein